MPRRLFCAEGKFGEIPRRVAGAARGEHACQACRRSNLEPAPDDAAGKAFEAGHELVGIPPMRLGSQACTLDTLRDRAVGLEKP